MALEDHTEIPAGRMEDLSWQQRMVARLRGIVSGPGKQNGEASREILSKRSQASEEESGLRKADVDPFAEKMQAVQTMWGKGFDSPCEESFANELVASLNLSKNNEVVELGAGLGGTGRMLAKQFGISVTSLVSSKRIGRLAVDLNNGAGLMGMVRVAPFKPERMGLQAKKYQCAIARESMYTVPDKAATINQIEKALAPAGRLAILDFVIPEERKESDSQALEDWALREPMEPHLCSAETLTKILQDNKFNVLTNVDETDHYYSLIIRSWISVLESIKDQKAKGNLDKTFMLNMLDEADHWARCAALLKHGHLKVCKVQAMKTDLGTK